jgi:coenzyme Q-binding protein COQ10
MPHLTLAEPSPYSPQQIFDLVADVARYHEFLPWCKAARIHSQNDNEFLAELVIVFKGFTEKFTSRVVLHPDTLKIDSEVVKGPFHHLTNHWWLEPLENGGTMIHLALDFQFKSKILESLIGGLFHRASEKMVAAFRERAEALYGCSS